MIISIDTDKKIDKIKSANRDTAEEALNNILNQFVLRLFKQTVGIEVEPIAVKDLKKQVIELLDRIENPPSLKVKI